MNVIKKVLKVLNIIFTWILIGLLLLAIYGKIQMMTKKQNYVTIFGYTMFQVASNSMEPVMMVDDVILVKVGSNYTVNDIISFKYEGAIVTHRILNIDGDNITVKGDANNTIDAPIKKDTVIGKVIKVLPKLKVWQQIMMEPKILICLFITLLFFDLAISYKGKDKNKIIDKNAVEKNIEVYEKNKLIDRLIKNTVVRAPAINKKDRKKQKTSEPIIEDVEKDTLTDEELLMLTQKIDLNELNSALAKHKKEEDNIKNEELITQSDLIKLAQEVDLEELGDLLEIDKKHLKIMHVDDLMSYKQRLENMRSNIKEMNGSISNQDLIDYTIRLDLKEIQRQISKRVK